MLPCRGGPSVIYPLWDFRRTRAGSNPLKVLTLMYEGSFGGSFSFQNTLTRAAPLMLTGLCTALPMRVGLVIIGGEGGAGHRRPFRGRCMPMRAILASMGDSDGHACRRFHHGGHVDLARWNASSSIAGSTKRSARLLLIYIAVALMNHLVEGPWRDPDKPQQALDVGRYGAATTCSWATSPGWMCIGASSSAWSPARSAGSS